MKCKSCKLEIFGVTLINHLNDSYHPSCFHCLLCQDVIKDPYFTDPKTNEIYCAKCQIILNDREKKNRDSLGFCNSCFKFLSEHDNVIIIDKEKYHNNCFKCSICKDLIRGSNFSREIMTSTSSNYCCNSCLYSGRVDKCPFCNGVVLGNSMFVPNFGNFHPKCFKCSSCQVVIKHSSPFTIGKNNKPTCQQCTSNNSVGAANK
ncbi:hypothetical protein DICPUDRAFT_45032 [Dictyostelium purpureum]|uniref:LIM zinc-binding domain-containing protein n=1 Tax=Dictyostelium purpureum TaxID=5786 RepID=F0Z8J1_DICPU|nr:uncharacterized protein DICPUDRAFT_45032 [Dictyostelium purpureum]EGC39768.1 hypothetical protein DICPUDRAFT_45032 [Dictyostelium purpureum]|eukprot:XP_003283754.1 hypothetical protein DICPUDRAFT_45032 [Dictyostelium purpureum]